MSYSSPKEKTTCILAICVKFCKLLMWSKKREKRGEKREKGEGRGKREEGRESNDIPLTQSHKYTHHFVLQVYAGNIFPKLGVFLLVFLANCNPFMLFSKIPHQFLTVYLILLPFYKVFTSDLTKG